MRARRTPYLLVLACVLMVVVVSGCDWTTYLQGNNRSGWSPETGLTPTTAKKLHLAWKVSDSGGTYTGVFSQPTVANNTVYWGSFDGYERATDTSGHLLWKTNLGITVPGSTSGCVPDEAGVTSTATYTSDVAIGSVKNVLYVGGGDSKVYALNAATGAVLWSHLTGPNPSYFVWSSPLVYGNSVYIGVASYGDCPLVQGQLLQLNRTTGAVQHAFNVVPSGCIGGGIWSSPTIDTAAGTIYVTTGTPPPPCGDNSPLAPAMVELRASDLSFVGSWTLPLSQQLTDADFGATPTLFTANIGGTTENLVGAINKNGIYYAFKRDALGAGPIWTTRIAYGGGCPQCSSGDAASSAWDGTTLYVGGDTTNGGSGSINALNPATGAFIWQHIYTDGFVLGGVSGAAGGIIAVGEGNNISVVSAATGNPVYTYTGGTGPFWGPPSIANGVVYEGDMAGHLYALSTS